MIAPAPFRFHPSSIGNLMSDPTSMDQSLLSPDELAIWKKKSRTDDEQALMAECRARGLSEGAKTYLINIVKEMLFGYTKIVNTKEMKKGIRLEPDAIQLYNHLHFTSYTKNTERRVDDILTGECDIHDPGVRTIDTKVSWCIDSFPVLSEQAHDPIYEWQGRGYMRLYDTPEHEVAYIMLSTPDDLLPGHEQVDLHKVDHIDPKLRVTKIAYQRCPIKERKMVIKCLAGQKYLGEVVARVRAEHGVVADWKKQFLAKGV